MSSYEAKVWQDGVLVPVTSWEISQLMAHHDECRIRQELRRSQRTGESQERRLQLANDTACTCGRREAMDAALASTTTGVDRRDNRDPAQVGEAYLNRPK